MKKKLLLFSGLLLSVIGNAQLAAGSTAPDFSVTDINGNVQTLSTYLNAGKTVILDISATWCGPCWNYHSTHALEDLYDSYGPNASNEVVVLFVEGDNATTIDDLYGTGTNTQGDWTAGSPYPIIDSGEIANLYEITYFPTVYRICPDGTATEVGSATTASLRNGINTGCGTTMTGVQNHVKLTANDIRICSTTSTSQVKIKNYGKNNITNANVVLKKDGTVIASQNYTGNMAQYGTANINFPAVTFDPAATYTANVNTINTVTPYSPAFAAQNLAVFAAQTSPGYDINVNIYTDNYPTEISWKIKSSNGTVVASGGPYVGNANGGGDDANTVKTTAVTLPSAQDCYTVQLIDAYGDGWSGGTTEHGIEITAGDATIFQQFVGNFGTSSTINAAFNTNAPLSVDVPVKSSFGIYPNPSTGIFNLATPETVAVAVMDITGKAVYQAASVADGGKIDLTGLQTGVYIARITGETIQKTEKLLIK